MAQVTLIDGTVVDSASEEWRHECEARAVLKMPTLAKRRAFLYGTLNKWGKPEGGVLGRRGEAAVRKLEDTMMLIWNKSK